MVLSSIVRRRCGPFWKNLGKEMKNKERKCIFCHLILEVFFWLVSWPRYVEYLFVSIIVFRVNRPWMKFIGKRPDLTRSKICTHYSSAKRRPNLEWPNWILNPWNANFNLELKTTTSWRLRLSDSRIKLPSWSPVILSWTRTSRQLWRSAMNWHANGLL